MMVKAPRIATVSYFDAIPFIYGIGHEGNFSADLLLCSPQECVDSFREGRVDMALLPACVVPSLRGARVVTEYCIGSVAAMGSLVLTSEVPIERVQRILCRPATDPSAVTAVQLAGYLCRDRWQINPEFLMADSAEQSLPSDGHLRCGVEALTTQDSYRYDLMTEWHEATQLPFAFAVWVAHTETDPELIEGLQYALTFGVEHSYEALLAADMGDACNAVYTYISSQVDYIYDNQKQKALQQFWDAGIKIAPRMNPG